MFTGKFDLNSHRGGVAKTKSTLTAVPVACPLVGQVFAGRRGKTRSKTAGRRKKQNKTKARRRCPRTNLRGQARGSGNIIPRLARRLPCSDMWPRGGAPSRGLRMRSPVASSNGDPTKSMCAEARYLIQWRPGQRLPYAAPRRGLEPKAGHNQALTLKTILGRILLYSFFGVGGGGGIMVLSGGLTGKALH